MLQGDRFDLSLDQGRIGDVALSQGTVEMPTFRVRGADAVYRFAAQGAVRDILTVLDGPKLHLISGVGFDRNRTAGQAAVKIEVRRPMLFDDAQEGLHVLYEGVIQNGGAQTGGARLGSDQRGPGASGRREGLHARAAAARPAPTRAT